MNQQEFLPKEMRSAVFSDDRAYRYRLSIIWDDSLPLCQVIGLNPSTADEVKDDPTIRRCKSFARDTGHGGLVMTNLFAYRATDPELMKVAQNPIGESGHYCSVGGWEFGNRNDFCLWTTRQRCKLAIAAWGVHGTFLDRAGQVLKLLSGLSCLGTTKDGHPKHPLYLSKTTRPEPYPKL